MDLNGKIVRREGIKWGEILFELLCVFSNINAISSYLDEIATDFFKCCSLQIQIVRPMEGNSAATNLRRGLLIDSVAPEA